MSRLVIVRGANGVGFGENLKQLDPEIFGNDRTSITIINDGEYADIDRKTLKVALGTATHLLLEYSTHDSPLGRDAITEVETHPEVVVLEFDAFVPGILPFGARRSMEAVEDIDGSIGAIQGSINRFGEAHSRLASLTLGGGGTIGMDLMTQDGWE